VRVLTWNLWGRFGPWQSRADAIAATLAQLSPDLCGLQEVWSSGDQCFAADLAGRLGLHWRWAMASRGRPGGGEEIAGGNAILSRWPIVADAELRLPVPDGDQGRVALHARVQAPGGVLPFFTTHLTHHPGASQIRLAQVRRLAEFVAAHAADCDYPPLVTGDLNAESASDEVRLLGGLLTAPAVAGQVLVDAWRYADPADPGFTWSRRNGYHTAPVLPDGRIDYILAGLPVRGRGRIQAARLAGHAPVDGVWPSDHFAVVADVD
jgi:endonuclease/exonuclease/phosphatase family metal-dependent hydrolase